MLKLYLEGNYLLDKLHDLETTSCWAMIFQKGAIGSSEQSLLNSIRR